MNLFNNNFEYDIRRMKKDDVGNLLVLDIKLCNKLNVSLVNIYGPNQDSPDFYNKIYDIIHEFDNEFIILCGDWNLVQIFSMDTYNYVAQNNKRSVNNFFYGYL